MQFHCEAMLGQSLDPAVAEQLNGNGSEWSAKHGQGGSLPIQK
jgi:hypothetical protein